MSRTAPFALLLASMMFLSGALSPALAAEAQTGAEARSPWGSGVPRLGETGLMSAAFALDPFIRTSLRSMIGCGSAADVELLHLDLSDSLRLGIEGDLVYAHLSLQYQHAVQSWLALYGDLAMSTRLGSEVPSVLTQGVSVLTGVRLGWLVRLWRVHGAAVG